MNQYKIVVITLAIITLISLFSLVGIMTQTVEAADPAFALTEVRADNVSIPKYDGTNAETSRATLLNIPWQSATVDELSLWGANYTYFTVPEPGLYQVTLLVGFLTTNGVNAPTVRFHIGILCETKVSEYATQVADIRSDAAWLTITSTYRITDPSRQFIYGQVESRDVNTMIAQARMQIIKMG